MDDDVWADDDSDHGQQLAREARSREATFHNAGYREGIEEGKSATLQQGFNIGFSEGTQAGLAWGRASACIKTLEIFAGQVSGTSQIREAVAQLAARINQIAPRQAMLASCQDTLSAMPEGQGRPRPRPAPPSDGAPGRSGDGDGPSVDASGGEQRDVAAPEVSSEELAEAWARLPELIAEANEERQRALAATYPGGLPDIQVLVQDLQQQLRTLGFDIQ